MAARVNGNRRRIRAVTTQEPPDDFLDDPEDEGVESLRIAPQDLGAEAAVLSAIMLDRAALDAVAPILRAEHFYSDANRRVFEAAIAVRTRGADVDVVSVAADLRNRERLDQVGGSVYLAQLVDAAPAVAHIETYAAIILDKWRMRQLIATCQRAAAEGYAVSNADDLVGRTSSEIEALANLSSNRPKWRSPADRATTIGAHGQRIETGFATLDAATRGGPRTGRVIIIGGAPGAGKTTLATQLGIDCARRGIPVSMVAADEDADGLLIRIGQNENLDREDLENGVEGARRALADRLRDLPLLLFDADEDNVTVEIAAAELTRLAAGKPGVLIVDSLQTVSAFGAGEADSPRGRVDAVMAALKRLAKQTGHLIVATSEVSRGWYRNTNDRIDPLAAFKESGGIEYGASVAIAMVNVKGEDDTVDAIIAKNRLGKKGAFRLKLSFARARFAEVPMPADDADDVDQRTEEARASRARERILSTLRQHTDLASMTAVSRAAGKNKKENLDALRELTELVPPVVVRVAGVYKIASNGGAQ